MADLQDPSQVQSSMKFEVPGTVSLLPSCLLPARCSGKLWLEGMSTPQRSNSGSRKSRCPSFLLRKPLSFLFLSIFSLLFTLRRQLRTSSRVRMNLSFPLFHRNSGFHTLSASELPGEAQMAGPHAPRSHSVGLVQTSENVRLQQALG